MRVWRVERRSTRKGTTWRLRSGSGKKRRTVTIRGDEAAARQAHAGITLIEAHGEGARWLRWYERQPIAAHDALRRSDPVSETRRHGTDYGGMSLRAYHREVYWPWRKGRIRSRSQEDSHWTRILRELGHMAVRDVDAWAVADYLDAQCVERPGRRKGMPLAGNTKRLHRSAIQALLTRAHRLRHIDTIPDLARFRIAGSTAARREAPLTPDETRALLSACSTKLAAIVALGALNGLRPSEILRVRWEDLQWDARLLHVRGTKTDASGDTIPITAVALPYLRALWMERGQPIGGVAIEGRPGQPYTSISGFKRTLHAAAERAGITGRRVTPYLLRASFATLAWEADVPEDAARRILRHTDSRMLREVYSRPRPGALAQKLAGFTL